MDDAARVGSLMDERLIVTIDGRAVPVATAEGDRVIVNGAEPGLTVSAGPAPGEISIASGDRRETLFAIRTGDAAWVFQNGRTHLASVEPEGQSRARSAHHHGSLTAPMPATVIAVNVKAGDAVAAGQILLVLEAMKMELPVRAPADGVVDAVHCSPGELVQPNVSLIDLAPADAEPTAGSGGAA